MSSEWLSVAEIFGEDVFNDAVMQERLPKKVYKKLKQTIEEGKELDLETADVIAHEMKEWAIEKGATHYTHWFQPLTGVTAEKHDSFISAPLPSGKVLTGEWYIGSISMKDNKTIRGSIEMRFTAYYDTPSTAQIDDYLGMECWFDYDPETQTFMFDCFDTSVI